MTQTLGQLENRGAFIERHIGPDAQPVSYTHLDVYKRQVQTCHLPAD